MKWADSNRQSSMRSDSIIRKKEIYESFFLIILYVIGAYKVPLYLLI